MENSVTMKEIDSIKDFIESYLIEKKLYFENWKHYVGICMDTLKVIDVKNNNHYEVFISIKKDNKFGFGICISDNPKNQNIQKYQNETLLYDNDYKNSIKSIINNIIN